MNYHDSFFIEGFICLDVSQQKQMEILPLSKLLQEHSFKEVLNHQKRTGWRRCKDPANYSEEDENMIFHQKIFLANLIVNNTFFIYELSSVMTLQFTLQFTYRVSQKKKIIFRKIAKPLIKWPFILRNTQKGIDRGL